MRLSKLSGWLATLLVVATASGAVASLATGLFLDGPVVATLLVVVLVALVVAVASARGARSRRWLYNGGYW